MKPSSFTRWHCVVDVDQRHSRRSPDRVPDLLQLLRGAGYSGAERTTGDEIQLLVEPGQSLADLLEVLVRAEHWRVGVGFGAVETPVPASVREARGAAFIAAREAIGAAGADPSGISFATPHGVVGAADYPRGVQDDGRERRVSQAHAAAVLLHQVWSRRTREGWDVVDVMNEVETGREAANRLGISPSAVSQRLRAAGYQAGLQGRALLDGLVDEVLQ